MFPTWRGKIIYPRQDADREMSFYRLDIYDIIDILDDPDALDCERGKRKEYIIVKCIKRGNKLLKVVVEETPINLGDVVYPAWRVRHVGEIGKR